MGSHSDHHRRHRSPSDKRDKYDRSSRRDKEERSKKDDRSRKDRSSKRQRDDSPDKKHRKKKEKKRSSYDDDEDQEAPSSNLRPSLDQLGYSNVNNPFNDINLESKFVWGKKKQRDKKELGLSETDLRRRERDRKQEADDELAKLNKRRAEREREIELREEEMARIQRDAELAQMGDWETKEEEFHLEQAKRRAEIRIKEGRAKPIDILAMNLRLANEPDKVEEEIDLEIDLEEPYTIFDHLSYEDTKELHQDIKLHLMLEKNEKSLDFWRAMIVIADDRLEKMRNSSQHNIADEVNQDVNNILAGKSVEQLAALQKQVMGKLSSGDPVDVEYWEDLLKETVVYKAKAKLNEMHQDILSARLQQLREKQREEATKVQEELERVLAMQEVDVYGQGVGPGEGIEAEPVDEALTEAQDNAFAAGEDHGKNKSGPINTEKLLLEEYSRAMSPEPMSRLNRDDAELELVDPLDDTKDLVEQRRIVLASKVIPRKQKPQPEVVVEEVRHKDESIASTVLFEQEAAKGIDEDEDLFNIEAELAQQTYKWQDKYRPRKPKYFNRVHTGYEWNKYNQTHYDLDNPPPKVVQGYKFNIFYPDLIDKSVAPTYYIDKDPESTDTVLIRFHAGPPYEDIAFRIVNREWEYSHKKGFKCSFDRGVLSLWFHFKRQFYRK